MNTRKYPRSMTEAFGPYANGPITEPDRPMDWQDRVVLTASVVVGVVFVGLLLVGVVCT